MSRKERRLRDAAAKKQFANPVAGFVRIDLDKCSFIPQDMTSAYRNNRYTVMVYDNIPTTKGLATQILVQRLDDKPIPNHWSEMQTIKNELFGNEVVAIEYYPKESELINLHNIYWMWIFGYDILPCPIF